MAAFLVFGISQSVLSQVTYSTSGNCAPTQPNYFTTASCWNRTLLNGCSGSLAPPSPLSTANTLCPITIVIDHVINLSTLTIGNNVTIQVNSGGQLNISGNLIQTGQTTGNFNIYGGQVNVGGNYILNQ